MQNDFIDGALGTKEAVAIVPNVIETIKGFEGTILYTKDTHFDDYMDTPEARAKYIEWWTKPVWA